VYRLLSVALMLLASFVPTVASGQPPVRWAAGSAILVFVDQANAPVGAAALVDKALATWSTNLGHDVTLKKTDAAAAAGIRVRFAKSRGEFGETRPEVDIRTRTIVKADVVITSDTGGDDPVNQRIVFYLTALHELGHALGLPHTDNFADIMYSFRRPDDGDRYFGAYRRKLRTPADIGSAQASGLSPNDLLALRELYGR
jgi:hypothetical protein